MGAEVTNLTILIGHIATMAITSIKDTLIMEVSTTMVVIDIRAIATMDLIR